MTESQITEIFKRVKKWPKSRQRDAAQILIAMERQNENAVRPEERAGVGRQRAEKKLNKLTPAQIRKYLQQQWDALADEKDPKKRITDFNRNLHIPGVPEIYLTGKAARNLDRSAEEGVQEYLEGKTMKAPSISAAVRQYRSKHA